MRLDGATLLLQWATGGLLAGWYTTRRREVGLGYGWLLRIVYALMAVCAAALFATRTGSASRVALGGSLLCAAGASWALAVSVARRGRGVRGVRADRDRRHSRVQAMLGAPPAPGRDEVAPEFPPVLDLLAASGGVVGVLGAAGSAGGPFALAAARLLFGAAFMGALTDAMLLGHWYLVQPGMRRDPLRDLVRLVALLWPLEVAALLWPTGMVQVMTGTVDDGFRGVLAWAWVTCALTTLGLTGATWLALRERSYSAVMAATGLLYLAILTGLGCDLVARAALVPR